MMKMLNDPPRWARALGCCLTALLFVLSQPNLDQHYLAWIMFLPLLFAMDGLTPRQAALMGFATGLAAWVGLIYWMVNIAFVALLFLTLYEAAWWCLFLYVLARWRTPLRRALFGPLFWVTLEWLRSLTPLGFSWGAAGLSQYKVLPFLQSASWGGVSVLSYAILAVSFAAWFWLFRKGAHRWEYALVTAPVLLAPVLFVLGIVALSAEPEGELSPPVCLVQGNLEVHAKMLEDSDTILMRHMDLSWSGVDEGSELLIWPETTVVDPLTVYPDVLASIENFVLDTNVSLFFGAIEADTRTVEWTNFNSAYFLARDVLPASKPARLSLVDPLVPVAELPRYDKVLPVPYGEYVPGKRFLPFVEQAVRSREGGAFTPGRELTLFEWEDRHFGALICFESTFAWHAREFVNNGADFLVNLTNDAWFGNTSAPWQHLSHSLFRAVENHVPVLRAANSGVTCFIDANGRVESSLPLFTEGALTGRLRLGNGGTFYSRHGNVFAFGCLIVLILGVSTVSVKREPSNR